MRKKIIAMFTVLNLIQMFADAGTLVNATGNFVNAYTGETTSFDDDHTMSAEMKTFYDTLLLDNARVDMKYAQFGTTQRLPKNHGKTVEWRKPNTFARASQLTEGVIPTGQKFGWSSITASINQFGTFSAMTDVLEIHAYDDNLRAMSEEMGASAAETQEYLIRAGLLTGTNVLYCPNYLGETFKSQPTSCATMYEGDATYGSALLTGDVVNRAATKMKKDKVPMINGKYYAVIHPSVAYDLRKDPAWVEAHKYAAPEEIFNGEIGELHGVRFIEDNFAPVMNGEGYRNANYSAVSGSENNGCTYATYFFGKDAFKTVDPEGGALEMIIKTKEEIGGPLEQFGTVGYKFETNGATIVQPERVLRVMSVSSYSSTDVQN